MHAVQRLYQYRKSIATKPFRARGSAVERCQLCLVSKQECMCALRQANQCRSAFILLMHDKEILKPSSTGKLIADIVDDTDAFIWQRTQVDKELLALLSDSSFQPYVVFPSAYVNDERQVVENIESCSGGKRPLFILFDASWREAKKMYRHSQYLAQFPVLSLNQDAIKHVIQSRQYHLRKASNNEQLCTAEVAGALLELAGEHWVAEKLNDWLGLFNYRYQKSVCQPNSGDAAIEAKFS